MTATAIRYDKTLPDLDPADYICNQTQELARELAQTTGYGLSGSLTDPGLHLFRTGCCSSWHCPAAASLQSIDDGAGFALTLNSREDQEQACPPVQELLAAIAAVPIADIQVFGFSSEILRFDLDCCPAAQAETNSQAPGCAGRLFANYGQGQAIVQCLVQGAGAELEFSGRS